MWPIRHSLQNHQELFLFFLLAQPSEQIILRQQQGDQEHNDPTGDTVSPRPFPRTDGEIRCDGDLFGLAQGLIDRRLREGIVALLREISPFKK